MMLKRSVVSLIAVVAAGATAFLGAQGAAAQPVLRSPVASSQAPVPVPYPGGSFSPPPPVAAGTCTPIAVGDNAHLSPPQVSAHGWWESGNCTDPRATVTVGLQEYFSDKTWRDKGEPGYNTTIRPGGGSSARVTAKDTCVGVALAGWRTYVIVDTPSGGAASGYTPAQNLKCTD